MGRRTTRRNGARAAGAVKVLATALVLGIALILSGCGDSAPEGEGVAALPIEDLSPGAPTAKAAGEKFINTFLLMYTGHGDPSISSFSTAEPDAARAALDEGQTESPLSCESPTDSYTGSPGEVSLGDGTFLVGRETVGMCTERGYFSVFTQARRGRDGNWRVIKFLSRPYSNDSDAWDELLCDNWGRTPLLAKDCSTTESSSPPGE